MNDIRGQRLDELESRLAFQEHIIESLSQVVARQDKEILELRQQLAELLAQVKEFDDMATAAGPSSGFEIPPHY